MTELFDVLVNQILAVAGIACTSLEGILFFSILGDV